MDHEARVARGNQLYDDGLQAFRRREQELSQRLNQESLEIFRALGEPVGTAKALIGLARVALRKHDFEAVRRFATEAASMLDGSREDRAYGSALHMLAVAHRMSGEDAEAARLYERTTAIYTTAGHEAGAAGELMNHGYARLHLGEREAARELLSASLARTIALGNPTATAYCVAACAAFAADGQNDVLAAELYGAALAELDRAEIVFDPDDQADYERYSSVARRRLGDESYAAEEQRGRELALSEAMTRARALLSDDAAVAPRVPK
ncbi:MAG: hypothetical protein NVS1B14_04760 [Vulcanimicrobiaceae bacterium]